MYKGYTIELIYHPHGQKVAHLHELKVGWIKQGGVYE